MNALDKKVKILSRSDERFSDRSQAGQMLAEVLVYLKGPQTVIVGIPRGGLIVAAEVAKAFEAPLDITLTRKIGSGESPELALGVMSEQGEVFRDHAYTYLPGWDETYVERERQKQMGVIEQLISFYRPICPKMDLRNRDIVLIDDGLATGLTIQAALQSLQKEGAHKITAAFPVGNEEALYKISSWVEEVVCLRVPAAFKSVSQQYDHFNQVTNEEAVRYLRECAPLRKEGV